MRGFYRFSQDGKVVGEFDNVITTAGKGVIAKYLAGLAGSYAGAIAVGVGTTTETASDIMMEYETGRAPIVVRNVSGPSSEIYQVSFKGVLPSTFQGIITEAGILSQEFNRYSGAFGDKTLSRFTSNEGWVTSASSNMAQTFETQGYDVDNVVVRVGGESSRFYATGASPSITMETSSIQGDLSGYSSADQLGLAYSTYASTSGTNIEIRLYSSASDYWFKTTSTPANTSATWQYNIAKFTKSQFSTSGSPTWSEITKCAVLVSSDSSTMNIALDGLSMFDTDYINPDYVLVSRALTATPIVKTSGRTMDVEYFLEFKL